MKEWNYKINHIWRIWTKTTINFQRNWITCQLRWLHLLELQQMVLVAVVLVSQSSPRTVEVLVALEPLFCSLWSTAHEIFNSINGNYLYIHVIYEICMQSYILFLHLPNSDLYTSLNSYTQFISAVIWWNIYHSRHFK